MTAPNRPEGELGIYTGSSRQGKTAALKQKIKGHSRVIVWSVKETVDKYGSIWRDTIYIKTLGQLKAVIRSKGANKRLHIVYTPQTLKDFGGWAALAHAMGILAPCSVVGEELADVTTANKAPEGWGNLLRQGLGWGINIYALTQRPAESEKTSIGNATYIHAHYQQRANDARYIENEMGLEPGRVKALQKLEWIESWPGGEIKTGKLKF